MRVYGVRRPENPRDARRRALYGRVVTSDGARRSEEIDSSIYFREADAAPDGVGDAGRRGRDIF